jgi:hypothetical protein
MTRLFYYYAGVESGFFSVLRCIVDTKNSKSRALKSFLFSLLSEDICS